MILNDLCVLQHALYFFSFFPLKNLCLPVVAGRGGLGLGVGVGMGVLWCLFNILDECGVSVMHYMVLINMQFMVLICRGFFYTPLFVLCAL